VLILLSLQLYLWLHLHELTTRIEPDAEGWNVAWIGVYRTRAALAVAVVSCLVLPVLAAITLAYRLSSTSFQYRRTLLTMSWTAVLASLLIGLFTVWRLITLRRACLR
jgi:ABC-type glycerol-3-phosphate transport system permease component